jgi:lipopolysaccharide export system protein LptA
MISLNFKLAAQFARALSRRCRRAGFSSISVLFALILLCPALTFAATDGALILERANSNENIYRGGELVSHLRGNVVFRYEDMRISSDEATWWKNAGRVDFRRKVKVEHAGQTMTCERMLFVRDRNLLTATGNVFYQDSAQVTFLSGNEAEYSVDRKVFTLKGKPLLVRKEEDEADTLFISGRIMTYNDSLKIATVTDSVRITRGSLTAASKSAEYSTTTGMAYLRISPEVFYEGHRVIGDSIDLHFGQETLKSARVVGNSHGRYIEVAASSNDTSITYIWSDSLLLTMSEDSGQGRLETMKAFGSVRGRYAEVSPSSKDTSVTDIWSDSLILTMSDDSGQGRLETMKAYGKVHGRFAEISPSSKDTAITHIWSDSLLLTMSNSGKLDSMQAFGKVLSRYFAAGDSARANEVSGRSMTLRFNEDGKIEKAFVRGNAKSIYYIEESDGGGRNEASGDQIVVTFILGRARLLHLRGNARGTFLPNIN